MRITLAIIVCKFVSFLSKLTKRKGSVIGGYWALKIYPNILEKINLPKYVIGVSGSSGKGTATKLIHQILKSNNITHVYNSDGSNVFNAITSLILLNCNLKGKMNKEVLLMELDEKHMTNILKQIKITHLVLTNITRDQPPRNTHPDYIQNVIKNSINKNIHLVINADDPYLYEIAYHHKGKSTFFGMNKTNYFSINKLHNLDKTHCPLCFSKMVYEFYHYGHIGKYKCPKCDFRRPKLDYEADNINMEEKTFVINNKKIQLHTDKIYKIYGILASYSVCNLIGITEENIINSLNKIKDKKENIYKFHNRNWEMLISKNENNLSYKQSIDYILHKNGIKTIVMGFDNSSRRYKENDISWIWDIEFENLNDKDIDKIILIGRFNLDFKVRLEYANLKDKIVLIDDLNNDLLPYIKNNTKGNIYSMTCFDKEIELKNLLKRENINEN